MGITEWIATTAVSMISISAYPGIFFLMMLESLFFPVPSEAVMPFAGFLVETHQLSWVGIISVATLGSLTGSLLSYIVGFYGGEPFVKKFGRFFLLKESHLQMSHRFFNTRGQSTIFIARFIPVVRHFISIPAGAAKMNIFKFALYTVLGAGMWNSFLTFLGYKLRQNWNTVMAYSHYIDTAMVIVIVIAVGYYVYKIVASFSK
ncbi:DedA family protein [Microbacter margulisiae]|uniref:Membrane protein DedA with SNARE-associated domain n=1 Tax=Microbacter margulisiae TaxID=1350067 RepID=A0A7W5DNL1_9PORP|nr:DedA family protein [Microbacter margulisiae]MBB3185858.1 membrane protein DedA with SNARE-associated domain [Microbacter margulisiae]